MSTDYGAGFSRPTREFYGRDPRATVLRNASLEAVDALGGVLAVGRDEHLSRLIDANSRLRELGIVPGMHSFEPDDPDASAKTHALLNDPFHAAEYAAGHTREAIAYLAFADGGAIEIIEEHDEAQGELGKVSVLDMRNMSLHSRGLVVGNLLIQHLENLLDAAAGPSELPG